MGLTNRLIQIAGVPVLMETLGEKAPELLVVLENLDEDFSLPELIAMAIEERAKAATGLPTKPISVKAIETRVDWMRYFVRFLCDRPVLSVLSDLLEELDLAIVAEVNLEETLKTVADYGET